MNNFFLNNFLNSCVSGLVKTLSFFWFLLLNYFQNVDERQEWILKKDNWKMNFLIVHETQTSVMRESKKPERGIWENKRGKWWRMSKKGKKGFSLKPSIWKTDVKRSCPLGERSAEIVEVWCLLYFLPNFLFSNFSCTWDLYYTPSDQTHWMMMGQG